jgi:hypothetical protein
MPCESRKPHSLNVARRLGLFAPLAIIVWLGISCSTSALVARSNSSSYRAVSG